MIGLLLPLAACVTAVLIAAATCRTSLVSALLVAYVALVANLGLVTLVLSPFRAVTGTGLTAAEAVLLAAIVLWWARGRPGLPLGGARAASRELLGSPLAALFLAVVVVLLGYELVLALTVPPDNWDSLTYHLARAAAWAQHGGVYWIPNAPTDRLNEFQPLAEQENLFLFAATGSGSLFALPQYVAELAILVAVYGSARRLGFGTPAAACAAFLFATFSLVVLESTTAQNDLVAASFPVVAACLILSGGRLELILAGAAAGIGLGAKLTTLLVLPVLVWLTLMRGRRAALLATAGAVLGIVSIGMWGFVLNAEHTGHLLGHGGGRVEDTASPSYPGSVSTVFYVLYEAMDLSVLSDERIHRLALAGVVAAVAVAAYSLRRASPWRTLADATQVAAPLLAPLLTVGAGGALAFVARRWGFPVRGSGGIIGNINRNANEDYAGLGPIGSVALLVGPALIVGAYLARRVDARHLALALAAPTFLVLLALQAKFNPFLTRFLLVPAALSAPLLATLFRGRLTTAAYLVVGSIAGALVLVNDVAKPYGTPATRPWNLTQQQTLVATGHPAAADALPALERLVPARTCVGAVLGVDEPSYLLFGPKLERRVVWLANSGAPLAALRKGLFYVVISTGRNRWVAAQFRTAGWAIRPLGRYWLLAVAPGAGAATCRPSE